MKDCLSNTGYMRADPYSNAGSWRDCYRRAWCNGGFRSALSADLQNAFKQFNCTTSNQYAGLLYTQDYFVLAAEAEIVGARAYCITSEFNALTQFTYYETRDNRYKHIAGSSVEWWERSPKSSSSTEFCAIWYNAGEHYGYASAAYGLSPFGCL